MKSVISMVLALSLAAAGAAATPRTAEKDGSHAQTVSLKAHADEPQVLISVSLISYPGVPERSSCRFLFRAENQSDQNVSLSTVLHTFDSYKSDLNSWRVPTGPMAPGTTIERLYSCKAATFLKLDKSVDSSWPRSCSIDGVPTYPCPIAVNLVSNLTVMTEDLPKKAKGEEGKSGH